MPQKNASGNQRSNERHIRHPARCQAQEKASTGKSICLKQLLRVLGMPLGNLASTNAGREIPAEDPLSEGVSWFLYLQKCHGNDRLVLRTWHVQWPKYSTRRTVHLVRNQDTQPGSAYNRQALYLCMLLTPVMRYSYASHHHG